MASNQGNQKIKEDNIQKIIFYLNVVPLIFAILMSIAIPVLFRILPEKMPLFYSLAWGEYQLGNHQQFFILPASIILVTLINLFLSWQLHQSQSFFKKLLLASSVITGLILAITFIKIVFVFI